jgi:putative membrane protein
VYFGVPLSNFGGWAIVGAATILLYQGIDRRLVRRGWGSQAGVCYVPAKALWGPVLYYVLLVFNLTVTFIIDEPLLACVGLLIFTPITVIMLTLLVKPGNQATAEDIVAHLADFPGTPLARWPWGVGIGGR